MTARSPEWSAAWLVHIQKHIFTAGLKQLKKALSRRAQPPVQD
jgi:hypothetical protein